MAEARGFDLRQKPNHAQVNAIEDALTEFGVLVFRQQQLDATQQDVFIRCFGPGRNGTIREASGADPRFVDVGTVDDGGQPIPPESSRGEYMRANQLWHTDASFKEKPIRLTALLARQLPPKPPPTEFADMRSAWSALPIKRRTELKKLRVVHSILRSREQMGMTVDKFDGETLHMNPPVVHPLVRIHPGNNRCSLYLASHASHIVGQPEAQGRQLIAELIEFATQPRFVYSHPWEIDDLVMWDDRWTMHRATPYNGLHPRKMRQCAIYELEAV